MSALGKGLESTHALTSDDVGACAIELKSVNKYFASVHANKDICLKVKKGTIHGIVGENGAGKSTLMSILYGFFKADSGEIFINGVKSKIETTHDAIAQGIGMVHQHFMLIDNFTVLENVMLGAEHGALLKEGRRLAKKKLCAIEKEYNLEVSLNKRIRDLPVGLQQRVEILKALYRGADILILDEPTGVLTPQEADHLFRILNDLRALGKTIILITHKLREIMAITDEVSIMRQGEMIATLSTSETDEFALAELMVGRRVERQMLLSLAKNEKVLLDVNNICLKSNGLHQVELQNISFKLHAGEIIGIAGVAGNGQTELLEVLAGLTLFDEGKITYGETIISHTHPIDAKQLRELGVAHIPEDRLKMALVREFSAYENAILGYQADPAYAEYGLMDSHKALDYTRDLMHRFDVRPINPHLRADLFSGGNQQKLVIGREFDRDPSILLIGQPTRGVDIGAIEFIHQEMIKMREEGKGIILVSVELDEILALCDRIFVMCDGKIQGELSHQEATEQKIGLMMAGIDA